MATKSGVSSGRGYIETAIGAFVGGVAGAVAGFFAGIFYVETFMPYAGLEGLLPPFIGTAAGVVLGIGVGVWGALRLRKHVGAGVTGVVAGVLGAVAAVAVLWAVEVALDQVTGRDLSEWFAPACAVLAAVLTAIGVRVVVARFGRFHRDAAPGRRPPAADRAR